MNKCSFIFYNFFLTLTDYFFSAKCRDSGQLWGTDDQESEIVVITDLNCLKEAKDFVDYLYKESSRYVLF